MRCSNPRTVGFQADGKTICWSPKQLSKEFASFQLPCGKCLECRLEYSRQWAIRCIHEAQMHPKNCFITLTYDEKHVTPKLDYSDFQKFMKKLRKLQNDPIGVFVTGEYGDKTKRPHWHAIIFNWQPSDAKHKYTNDRGDRVFSSETLDRVWGKGITEFGSVTIHSAGYCARYAAKKLAHGYDHDHDFHPISKKSNKHAIGKTWLEKYWPDVFNYGEVILSDGTSCSIPRYYEKWFKENKPQEWARYVTTVKQKRISTAEAKAQNDYQAFKKAWDIRSKRTAQDGIFRGPPLSPSKAKQNILREKFKLLQDNLKL